MGPNKLYYFTIKKLAGIVFTVIFFYYNGGAK